MSLFLPRLLDDLEGRVPRSEMIFTPGVDEKVKQEFCTLARKAEKFNFGTILLEPHESDVVGGRPAWKIPEMADVEIQAWEDGLIPLPSPVCWYECKMGGSWCGFLLRGEAGKMQIQRVDYTEKGDIRGQIFHGTWCEPKDSLMDDDTLVMGNDEQLEFVKHVRDDPAYQATFNFAADYMFAVYLTLMISSRTTEIKKEVPPAKLNKARIKSGHEALPNHYIVDLTPKQYHDYSNGKGGTHASPRLHWRRSHLRHFETQTGNSKWSPVAQHKGQAGWWVTLIPRQLVGVRELGEVTHEYRV